MKLDRNLNADRKGKYALVKLRGELSDDDRYALSLLQESGRLDWGAVGSPDEFFLIRLKDKYAQSALDAYANAARRDDEEYAAEIAEMAGRSGPAHPLCKRPD